jgi:hypothetical protein
VGRTTGVLVVGVVLTFLHAVDELLLQRQPGVPAGRHRGDLALLGVLTLLVTLTAVRLPGRVRAAWMVAASVAVGTVAAADGSTHLLHLLDGHVAGSDVSGLLGLVVGPVLLGIAVRAGWRLASAPPKGRSRWVRAVTVVVLSLATAVLAVMPVAAGTVQVRLPRQSVAPPSDGGYEPVALTTDDGVRLAAWYRRSANGAAVMVLASSRGDHSAAIAHASMLAAHGYGVLVYDARGSGASEGEVNGWGWGWTADVDAGVDFLASRPDVRGGRVALLGLSTGADVAIEAAARNTQIRAVVADGATAPQFADRPPGALSAVVTWPMFTVGALWSGGEPGLPLHVAIGRVAPRPVLLVASGSIPAELPLNEQYAERGGSTTTLWALPDVDHTKALTQVPAAYERRVLPSCTRASSSPHEGGDSPHALRRRRPGVG